VAVAGCDQVRQKSLGAVDNSPEVDVHHPLDVFELADVDVAGVGDSGVVVDLVDLAVVLVDVVGVDLEGLTFGDVALSFSSVCASPSASTSLIANEAPERPSSSASA
jgi:hypothetical protein